MRPIRLFLENFTSYAQPTTIHFGEGILCLIGPNGAGKSSLLDALTWAIWGRSRAGADHERLITHGRPHMRVELDFIVDRQEYRVVRSYTRRSTGGAKERLQLFVRTGDSTWKQITKPTLRETQEEILRLVKVSYDIFVASAYIRQGRANEFSIAQPARRKQILAEMLRIDYWDALERMVKDDIANLERSAEVTRLSIANLKPEADAVEARQKELEQTQAALAQAEAYLRDAEQHWQTIQKQLEQTEAACKELEQTERLLQQMTRERQFLHQEIKKLEQTLEQLESIERDAPAIIQAYEQLRAAQADLERLEKLRAEHQALSAQKQNLDATIQSKRAALQAKIDALKQQQTKIMQELEELRGVDAEYEKTQRDLQQAAETLQRAQNKHKETDNELERLQTTRTAIAQKRQELQHVESVLAHLQTHHHASDQDGTCPTCGASLSFERRQQLIAEYSALAARLGSELEHFSHQFERARAQLQTDRANLERQIQSAQAEVRRLEARAAFVEQRRARHLQLQKDLERVNLQVAEATEELNNGKAWAETSRMLEQISERIAALGFSEHAFQEAVRAVQRMGEAAARYQQLEHAQQQREEILNTLATRQQQLLEKQATLEQLAQKQATLSAAQARLPELRTALFNADVERQRKRQDWFHAQQQVAGAQQRLAAAEQARTSIGEQQKALQAITHRLQQLHTLREAFSKTGIPAMIIDNVVMDLEQDANYLLGKMTDDRMRIRLETRRQTNNNAPDRPPETLEIFIEEDGSERPYEMLSGGEAMRVDLALRVALSRLLARKHDTQLRMLCVDEGFGTQDYDGRVRITEVLHTLNTDFDLVIVITHIPDVQAAFARHLYV